MRLNASADRIVGAGLPAKLWWLSRASPLLLTLLATPAFASHQWGGVDICETRKDIMPPDMSPALLPEPASQGAQALQRYCVQCHYLTGPGRHTREEWTDVLRRMDTLMGVSSFYRGLLGPVAMPDAGERTALAGYLERHALRALPPPAGAIPPVGAERAYRAICGDCHAVPDPRAYAETAWPALLAKMDQHRPAMARAPLSAAQQAAVKDFIAAAWGGPPVAGSGHQGAALPLPAAAATASDPVGRAISLAAFFGLAAVGIWRWRRGRRLGEKPGRHPGESRGPEPALDSGFRRNDVDETPLKDH